MEGHERHLIFDPFAGIAGDMLLGALIDLGLEPEWLADLVADLRIDARARVETVKRGVITCRAVQVERGADERRRRLEDVLELIDAASLDPWASSTAAAAFRRLAEVEGALHGQPPEAVHFHELGAVDAIVDIVGACAGVQALGATRCSTRPVALGRGWVHTEHGELPLPAPATLRLLEGLPVTESGFEGELTTPTGALLLSVLTGGRHSPSTFTPLRSGYGAGSRDPHTHPNCLRVVLAEGSGAADLLILQADLDDMPPEYVPAVVEALKDAGALDVWMHPVLMKKGRQGVRIEALVSPAAREPVTRALFEGSTTIGARYWRVDREVLPRRAEAVEWHGHSIRLKTVTEPGGHLRSKPEYDDVRKVARATGIAAFRIFREIESMLERRDQ